MNAIPNRKAFETSRELEFFTEKELRMQIGCDREGWAIALIKELIDNSLDACESDNIDYPGIEINCDTHWITVSDNGPGIPESIVRSSLNYSTRTSTNAKYVSPTRGQLGNALKCIWAAAFVDTGSGVVEVEANGKRFGIDIRVDDIEQKPLVLLNESNVKVKNGTFIKLHWENVAGYLGLSESNNFYYLRDLIRNYSAFNPHAKFTLNGEMIGPDQVEFKKWKPNSPTAIDWYSTRKLEDLVKATIAWDRQNSNSTTTKNFLSQFSRFSGTAKQKAVMETAGLPKGHQLEDFVSGDSFDSKCLKEFQQVATEIATPQKPASLGRIGKERIIEWLGHCFNKIAEPEYRSCEMISRQDGLPYIIEIAFAVLAPEKDGAEIAGVNWSPSLGNPFAQLSNCWMENSVDEFDPVVKFIHLICPDPEFIDRGKSRLTLPYDVVDEVKRKIRLVTKKWSKLKRRQDRNEKLALSAIRSEYATHSKEESIQDCCARHVGSAYRKVAGPNNLPVAARQLMYAIRDLVINDIGRFFKGQAFQQMFLPEYIRNNPKITSDWRVTYDPRGKLVEPHAGEQIELGTLAVDEYCNRIPSNKFSAILFCEKEGFNPLFEHAKLKERFDIAIMSTKGQSTTSARKIVDKLSQRGIKTLVLHDFDKTGIEIYNTISSSNDRYQFESEPLTIDIGLRLKDVSKYGLSSERVEYKKQKSNPIEGLIRAGATQEEAEFLVSKQESDSVYSGQRVELNAFTSEQLIDFIENALIENGIEKVIPDESMLRSDYEMKYRNMLMNVRLREQEERIRKEIDKLDIEIPNDLREHISAHFNDSPTDDWNKALSEKVKNDQSDSVS